MTLPADALRLIDAALAEDVGPGDWTTLWTVPADRPARGAVRAKAAGVLAGTAVAREVFLRVDPEVEVGVEQGDGRTVAPGEVVLRLQGRARSLLTAERVALNLLQRLSGVATLTRAYVEAVQGTGARILDTRKTTPGMRALEKAAVRAGGGGNHRFGLHDMILVKENHITAAGGVHAAVEAVRRHNHQGLRVEVEAASLEEVAQALEAGVDRILLDNMDPTELRRAVRSIRGRPEAPEIEASGGIDLRSVRAVAEAGVDFISVGALTHSAPALDLSLLLEVR